MDKFIARENVRHFRDRLCTEISPKDRALLQTLLVEEENKLAVDLELIAEVERVVRNGKELIASQTELVALISPPAAGAASAAVPCIRASSPGLRKDPRHDLARLGLAGEDGSKLAPGKYPGHDCMAETASRGSHPAPFRIHAVEVRQQALAPGGLEGSVETSHRRSGTLQDRLVWLQAYLQPARRSFERGKRLLDRRVEVEGAPLRQAQVGVVECDRPPAWPPPGFRPNAAPPPGAGAGQRRAGCRCARR